MQVLHSKLRELPECCVSKVELSASQPNSIGILALHNYGIGEIVINDSTICVVRN